MDNCVLVASGSTPNAAGERPARAPVVSVIVPVYNKAAFLADCLGSILSQSLRGLEVICVDDASTDGSRQILERFAKEDARITIIGQTANRGAAAARNTGLSAARGEFVQFTDADDILPTDALGLLVDRARADNVEVVRGGVAGFHTEAPEKLSILDLPEANTRIRALNYKSFWVPWWHTSYLFSRQFLLSHGIAYPALCSGEDPVFLAQVLTSAPCLSTIADITYRYRLMPLEQKGRVTYRHLQDYLRHAEVIRGLFLGAEPDAWYRGFAPLLLPEIQSMVEEWQMTASERAAAKAEMARIFQSAGMVDTAQTPRRLLFMYNVCGLGGVEASIINKMDALRGQGVEAKALFQSCWGEGGKTAAQQPGFVVEAEVEAQARFLREWAPDAIVVIDSPWLLRIIEKSGVGSPVLFETHLSDQQALERRVLDGVSNSRVSAVIVPAEFNRAILAEHGFNPERVRVIPNSIDPARFAPGLHTDGLERLGLPVDLRLVLFVGRLEPQKNPIEFVRIAAELAKQDSGSHYVVVGDAVDTAEFAATVRREAQAMRSSFSFIERVPYEDMPRLFGAVAASGGCLVSTSLNESQPMIVLEAMACGCPVIASDVGGLREIIEDGMTGHLYQVGDVQAAASAASRLMEERERRDSVVRAAMDFVNSTHTPARAAKAYVAVLDEIGAHPRLADVSSQVSHQETQGGGSMGETNLTTLAQNLTALFSEKLLSGVRHTALPYRDVVPRVQLGFESSATVELEMRPKEDFSRSPDQCLNTLVLDYQGPSRWLTIETAFSWVELTGAEHYQIGVYGRPSRPLPCRVVLRIPNEEAFKDFPLCNLVLSPEGRPTHGRGALPALQAADDSKLPKLLLFFEASTDLHLELDYLTAYFA